MQKYVLVDDTHTILWGPDYPDSLLFVNGNPIVPPLYDSNVKWYTWTDIPSEYDTMTQQESLPQLSFNDNDFSVIANYEVIDLDINIAISNRCNHVNNMRDEYLSSGFTWNGNTYDSDVNGRANLSGAIIGVLVSGAIQSPNTFITWRTKNNINISLTAMQLVTLGLSMLQWYSSVIIFASTLKDSITALTNVQDVRDKNIADGWPTHN